MDAPEFGRALRSLAELAPSDITDTLLRLAREAGAVEVDAYLIDFEQKELCPIPDRASPNDLPEAIDVLGTVAGRTFAEREPFTEQTGRGHRVWVPILEGSACTGVLSLTLGTAPSDVSLRRCEELGMLAGAVMAIAGRQTDLFNMVRRRRRMSLPASMQWDLLPPLRIDTPEALSIGLLEPAYDVGGDSFDHVVNGLTLNVAIMDAMGHGLDSSLTSALAMGSYRKERREGQTLAAMHSELDANLAERFGGLTFVTGQLAALDLATGALSWVNAGHPGPLLVRGGRVAGTLPCRPSLPWGLGGPLVEQAEHQLEPGDAVVFYSDGVVEGRSDDGSSFGIDRLVEAIEESVAAQATPDLILRRAIDDVVSHQRDRLRDDATIVWLEWNPGS